MYKAQSLTPTLDPLVVLDNSPYQHPTTTPLHTPTFNEVPYISQPKSQTERHVRAVLFCQMFTHPMPPLVFLVLNMHRAHREE